MKQEVSDRQYFIASLVKLVANENIDCICKCATNLRQHFDEVEEIDNSTVYEAYCDVEKELIQ